MGKHVRGHDTLAPSSHSAPVPMVGQLLVRALPAATVLLAGFPLLAWWWSLNEDSPFWAVMALLIGNFLLALGILRITQGPRPRLGKKVKREPLQRAINITAENGVPPADPSHRAAVSALACELVEGAPLRAAAIVGFVLTAFVTGASTWLVPAGVLTISAVLDVRSTRRSWRYIKALHAAPPTVGDAAATRS
ncbi:hypothetical protein [Kocuria rosea]|uniref:hypothetical protein n=1 Tax=Kocuria rosea TaxID=1275 RepID=UPI00119D6CE1|nr:hypothetical protein [Kocuria rosea]